MQMATLAQVSTCSTHRCSAAVSRPGPSALALKPAAARSLSSVAASSKAARSPSQWSTVAKVRAPAPLGQRSRPWRRLALKAYAPCPQASSALLGETELPANYAMCAWGSPQRGCMHAPVCVRAPNPRAAARAATPCARPRRYETMVVLRPNMQDEERCACRSSVAQALHTDS